MGDPQPHEEILQGIVRVESLRGKICGAGLLLQGGGVFTCAHVVAEALDGVSAKQRECPVNPVRVTAFPYTEDSWRTEAKVSFWEPIAEPVADYADDVALLLPESQPPSDLRPLQFVDTPLEYGRGFHAYGFPAGHDRGVWASGQMESRVAQGWIQIAGATSTGHRIQAGFSGTPVWDEAVGGTAGIAVCADREASVKVAYMVLTRALKGACPQLAGAVRHPRPPGPGDTWPLRFFHSGPQFTVELGAPSRSIPQRLVLSAATAVAPVSNTTRGLRSFSCRSDSMRRCHFPGKA
jgi:hypothetical protein